MNERYDQPFYVEFDKRHRFRGVGSDGFLPALGERVKETTTEKQVITNVSLKDYQQQAGTVLFLQQKIEEHITFTNKDSY